MLKSNLIKALKTQLLKLFNLALLISMTGCLALPVPYRSEDPFPDKNISFIIPGITNKNTVKEKLGTPQACRFGEKIYIYAGGQQDWVWLWFVGAGYSGTGGAIPTYMNHLLIVEFNEDDVVTAVQEFCGDNGKLESGLYIINNGGYGKGLTAKKWSFQDEQLIIRASETKDKQAKQFSVPLDKSAIFYYKKLSHNLEAKLDNKVSVDTGSDGYLLWIVNPGDHTISASNGHHPENLTIRCDPGTTYYVEHREGLLREEHISIGEKEIAKRRLVCDRIDPFDFTKNKISNDDVTIAAGEKVKEKEFFVKSQPGDVSTVEQQLSVKPSSKNDLGEPLKSNLALSSPETPINKITVNENEPWTGKWRVQGSSISGGLWVLKQLGQSVVSTDESFFKVKGTVDGNKLEGSYLSLRNFDFRFVIAADGMSFEGYAADMNGMKPVRGVRAD